jgi:hypothetical protein
MLKRLLAASLAIALGSLVAWSSGPTGDRASAGATPVEHGVHEGMSWADEHQGGGGGDGDRPTTDLSNIAGEAGLGDMGTYY